MSAILEGEIDDGTLRVQHRFGLSVPARVPGIADSVLDVRAGYPEVARYDRQAAELARRFRENFAAFSGSVSAEVSAAGPRA